MKFATDKDVKFLLECAKYFRKRPTKGEDRAHWANVYNAENCERIAKLICPGIETEPRVFSGCTGTGGDCPTCGN